VTSDATANTIRAQRLRAVASTPIRRAAYRRHCFTDERVSKRLTANVFREEQVEAGTSAAGGAHTEAARLLQRRNHLIDHYRDLTRDFGADRVHSTSHDRGNGLEL